MADFIEELYYGNIDPQARAYRKDSRIYKILDDINEAENKLTECLQMDEKKLFLDFCNAYAELLGTSELDSFIVGFRLGAKLIYDTFCSDAAPFEDLLKEKGQL